MSCLWRRYAKPPPDCERVGGCVVGSSKLIRASSSFGSVARIALLLDSTFISHTRRHSLIGSNEDHGQFWSQALKPPRRHRRRNADFVDIKPLIEEVGKDAPMTSQTMKEGSTHTYFRGLKGIIAEHQPATEALSFPGTCCLVVCCCVSCDARNLTAALCAPDQG